MDILVLLDRCVGLESSAAEVYEILAGRFAATDPDLAALWSTMAAGEHQHARKLATWRTLAAAEAPGHRAQASGFAADLDALEALLQQSRAAAATADEEEAFALALALECSELDAIYTQVLQASPLARFPDLDETLRRETGEHHRLLLAAAERHCRSERNRLRMALLSAHAH